MIPSKAALIPLCVSCYRGGTVGTSQAPHTWAAAPGLPWMGQGGHLHTEPLGWVAPCTEGDTERRKSTTRGGFLRFVSLWSNAKHPSEDERAGTACGYGVREWSSMKTETSIPRLFFGSQDLPALQGWVPPLNTQENLRKQGIFLHSSARTWQNQTSVLTVQLHILSIRQMVLQ